MGEKTERQDCGFLDIEVDSAEGVEGVRTVDEAALGRALCKR